MPAHTLSLQDSEAFSQLFSRQQIAIFRFIYGLHGGPIQEVEDLTCDTFLRAWKSRRNFSGNEHDALCWLFTIARHLVIDAHRRRMSHRENESERLDEVTLDNMFPSTQYTPEELAARREQFNHLWKIVQALPPDRRELLVLRYMLGWQVKQIASYLHMQENTVSVYIRRSLEKIRHDWATE